MKKPLIVLAALIVALMAAGLFGSALTGGSSDEAQDVDSGGAQSAQTAQSDGEIAPDARATAILRDANTDAAAATTQVREPAVIRTGSVGISSDDVARDLGRVRAVATSLQGSVGSESSHVSGGSTFAELTLRVPNGAFDSALARLEDVAELTHREVSTEDVTTQVIDTDARVRAQRASVKSLQRLMGKARTVGEVMAVERELAQRQGELDSLLQQQRYLADQTSMSTISVTLSDDPDEAPDEAGFLSGLSAGWKALGTFLTASATAAGALLPFVPVLALVAVPAWLVVRRRRAAPGADGSMGPKTRTAAE